MAESGPEPRPRRPRVVIDRVACTGHGACAALLPDHVTLDPWGYPLVSDRSVPVDLLLAAERLCPRRALHRSA